MKKSGFTLIEVLIAMVIGGMILISAMSAYGVFANASQKMSKAQKLEKQTHFALTRISDRIRNTSIGYDLYGLYDPGPTKNQLFLGDGTHIEFRDENIFMNNEPFFSQEFFVEEAVFSVEPNENPFSETLSDIKKYIQPKVSLSLKVLHTSDKSIQSIIQTTISSRIYE